VVGIICPLVEIGLTVWPITGEAKALPAPPLATALLSSHIPRSAFSWHCSKIKLFKSVTGGLLLSLLKPQGYGRRRDYHSTKLYQGNSTDYFYLFLLNRYSISLNLLRNKKHKLKIM
jgi:hypothetical protein